MRLSISEILKRTSSLSTTQERVDFLRANQSVPLYSILKNTFDSTVQFLLPPGAPPYKPNPYPGQELRLYAENRRLYIFIEGQSPNINRVRREQLFIEILEAVDPEDAKLLIAMKDKQSLYPAITGELVIEAFPGLIVSLQEEKNEAPIEPERVQSTDAAPPEAKGAPRVRRGKAPVQGDQTRADEQDDAKRGSRSKKQES